MSPKCPECQFENPPDTNFCGKCGTRLYASEEVSISPTKTLETPAKELGRKATFAEKYEIIEELGTGGMGKVYKAFDMKIEENVALKVLKPEIASDEKTIERFRNELKLARKISHRNVCRMYDLNEEEGTHYIVMEYVPGENLKSSIRRMGPLSPEKAVFIAKQVCEGLAEAHRLGVIHRDLKPQNIMIDAEGNARIMDFGVARSIRAKGITEAGVMIGTPEYMSPEQVEGREVDNRSDIYALGIIIYEMVTGKVPFEGETPIIIAVKQKTETPKNPKEVNTQIPDSLCRLILKCMEKNKEKRYQRAEEVLSELNRIEKEIPTTQRIVPRIRKKPEKTGEIRWLRAILWGVSLGGLLVAILLLLHAYLNFRAYQKYKPWIEIDSIAVLPFKNLSGNANLDYIADQMTGALIDDMTKTGILRQIPPMTSVMQYKTTPKKISKIAQELNVKAVIEGAIFSEGRQTVIQTKLVDPPKEQIVWDNTYKKEALDNLFLQRILVRAISDEILYEISSREVSYWYKSSRPSKRSALGLYKIGRYFWDRHPWGTFTALGYFEQAIEADPLFGPAYTGIADIYGYKLNRWPEAMNLALKALKIEGNNAEVSASIGKARMNHDFDWPGAEIAFRKAIYMNPTYLTAHQFYAEYLVCTARFDEAMEEMKRALELDPISMTTNYELGRVYYYYRKYDQAIEAFKKTIEIEPLYLAAHVYLGMSYMQKSMYEKALQKFQEANEPEKGKILTPLRREKMEKMSVSKRITTGWTAVTYAMMGKKDNAKKILEKMMETEAWWRRDSTLIAKIYFALGEKDNGFKWLEKAYQLRDPDICLLKVDPAFDSVRSDPRFLEMLKKMGLNK